MLENEVIIYILDLIGTFAFAYFGAYIGQKNNLDIFGVFICGFLTAVGGGTIREVILSNDVPFYFTDNNYVITILVALVAAIVSYHYFGKLKSLFLIVDAIGLAAFAFIGASRAADHGLGLFAMVFFAVTTAVGGGILRDVAIRKVPYIFANELYATPPAVLGAAYWIFSEAGLASNWIVIYSLLAGAFALRLLAIKFNLQLWKPNDSNLPQQKLIFSPSLITKYQKRLTIVFARYKRFKIS